MKKILISIFIVLLLILGGLVLFKGVTIGNLHINSLAQIEQKNQKLDDSILEATSLATKTYEETKKTLEADVKQLEEQKKKYDNLVSVSNSSEAQTVSQYQKYEIEYLWTIVGNHATKEGVVLKMDLVTGANNTYNLNFTVTGEYIGIADFIYDIENDSALGFKIEDFYMVPESSSSDLKATFTCKEITIKDISSSSAKTITTIDSNTDEAADKAAKNSTTNNAGTNSNTTTNTTNANSSSSSKTSSGTTNDENDLMKDLQKENN